MDKNIIELTVANNSKENKVEIICDNAVYMKMSKSDHLLGFYYLVS